MGHSGFDGASGPERVGVDDGGIRQPGFDVVKPARARATIASCASSLDSIGSAYHRRSAIPSVCAFPIAVTAPPATASLQISTTVLWKSNPT